jgi:hypothetical protein
MINHLGEAIVRRDLTAADIAEATLAARTLSADGYPVQIWQGAELLAVVERPAPDVGFLAFLAGIWPGMTWGEGDTPWRRTALVGASRMRAADAGTEPKA